MPSEPLKVVDGVNAFQADTPVARYCCVIPEASLNVFAEAADTCNGVRMKVAKNTNTSTNDKILLFL